MNAIVNTRQPGLPAHIQAAIAAAELDDSLSSGVGGGYPNISFRGRTWRIVQNGDEHVVTQPGSEDPASSLEVVVLKANKGLSKVFYAKAYVEGNTDEPDCFSHDGIAPDPSVETPVATRCATCPNNVWGSKITPQGKQTKACSDSRRVAVVPVGDLNNPMLLRVPAASLAELAEFGRVLMRRGIPYHAVVTKLGFDTEASYPKLTFKPARYLDEDQFTAISTVRDNPVIEEICGKPGVAGSRSKAPAQQQQQQAKPAPAPAPTPAPEPAKAAPQPAAEEDLFDAPAPAPEKPKRAKKANVTVAESGGDLEQALDNLLSDFDA